MSLVTNISDAELVNWFNNPSLYIDGMLGFGQSSATFKPYIKNPDELVTITFSSFICWGRTLKTVQTTPRVLYHIYEQGKLYFITPPNSTCTINYQMQVIEMLTKNNFVGFIKYIYNASGNYQLTGQGYSVTSYDQPYKPSIDANFKPIVGRNSTETEFNTAFPVPVKAPTVVQITQPESVLNTPTIQQNINEIVEQGGVVKDVTLGDNVVAVTPDMQQILEDTQDLYPTANIPEYEIVTGQISPDMTLKSTEEESREGDLFKLLDGELPKVLPLTGDTFDIFKILKESSLMGIPNYFFIIVAIIIITILLVR